jgi:hypothetical protein
MMGQRGGAYQGGVKDRKSLYSQHEWQVIAHSEFLYVILYYILGPFYW